MKKQVITNIVSGIVGGALVMGSFLLLGFHQKQHIKIKVGQRFKHDDDKLIYGIILWKRTYPQ